MSDEMARPGLPPEDFPGQHTRPRSPAPGEATEKLSAPVVAELVAEALAASQPPAPLAAAPAEAGEETVRLARPAGPTPTATSHNVPGAGAAAGGLQPQDDQTRPLARPVGTAGTRAAQTTRLPAVSGPPAPAVPPAQAPVASPVVARPPTASGAAAAAAAHQADGSPAAPADGPAYSRGAGGLPPEQAAPARRRWPIFVAVGVALLAVAYIVVAHLLAGNMPNGLVLSGVPVGGLGRDEALQQLEEGLQGELTAPVVLQVGDKRVELDPAAAGLQADLAASVDRYTEVSYLPQDIFSHLFGAQATNVETVVDKAALRQALTEVAPQLTTEPRPGGLHLEGIEPIRTEPATGLAPDLEASVELVADKWLAQVGPLQLPARATEPSITGKAVDEAVGLARTITGAPAAVVVGDKSLSFTPEQLAALVSFEARDGKLVPQINVERLHERVHSELPGAEVAPVDAKFVFEGGKPKLEPSVPGAKIEPDKLAAALLQAASSKSDRNARPDLVEQEAQFTTEAAEKLGIKEVIVEFSTPLTEEPQRTENIRVGSEKITGTLIKPGETFSLEEALGPVELETGFVDAGVIVDGLHSSALGGGLSQLATNTFNAGFLAGFEDIEHKPHSEYLDRYPAGREATLWTGKHDVKWQNNTEYGVLVQAGISNGEAWIKLWSTKYWEVTTNTSDRYDFVAPITRYSTDPRCEPTGAGNSGFSVTVERTRRHGQQTETQSWETRYVASDEIICGPQP
ncbi:VanW family protein [Buchananella hordeovulneris]|uniref:VanW family protein n=1 Tax=Buchananella hordeovulneris TaxID=52770 RepID=UPI000F5E055D|nr:VanW family protein [Buchananella hordeovulneris]RRD44577.1 vanomycin resistance protein VanB [Buchananella hordeovulneris]